MENSPRPRVICHMMTSIDGRIVADNWPDLGENRKVTVDMKDVKRFERELLDFVRGQHADALAKVRTVKDIKNDDVKSTVKKAVEAFKRTFQPSGK